VRGDLVVARAGGSAVVVDLAAGAVAGAFRCAGPVALRGDDLVHASDDRRALVLRDLRGEELARADLPWAVGLLAVGRDRALLAPADDAGRRHPVAALDLGAAPGRVLWATESEHRAARLLVAGRRALRVTTGWRLERFDLES